MSFSNCYFLVVDLMPSVNDFMVVVIIPSLEYLVYPHLERVMKIKIRPLHKVTGANGS